MQLDCNKGDRVSDLKQDISQVNSTHFYGKNMALASLSQTAIDAAKRARSQTSEQTTHYSFEISVGLLEKFKIAAGQADENIGDLIRDWVEDYVRQNSSDT